MNFFLFLLCFLPSLSANKPNERYYFDSTGILHINGSFHGMSEPIALEKNTMRRNSCYPNRQFYLWTFCADQTGVAKNKRCDQGMIICYDGILSEGNALSEFVLENVDNVVTQKCEKFHGFRVALRRLPAMVQYQYKEYHDATFFEIQTSFMKESYFYPTPLDLCINLWMGSETNDLLTYVTDRRNQALKPVRVWDFDGADSMVLKGVVYGGQEMNTDPPKTVRAAQIEREFFNLSLLPTIPDVQNREKFCGDFCLLKF